MEELNWYIGTLEEKMIEYSEMTSLGRIHDLYNWSSDDYSKTPEYNSQKYTFKYGSYDMLDFMNSFS